MAIVMQMRWDGIDAGQYAQACEHVAWETDAPAGGIFHVAWVADGALNVVDVWESAEEFQRFVDDRLMPVVKGKLGFPGEPEVTTRPALRYFDAVHRIART